MSSDRSGPTPPAGGFRIGILEMATRPLRYPGAMGNPDTHPCPVVYTTVEGAYTDRVLAGDPEVAQSYARKAQELEAQGVNAIFATCGFTILFQGLLAASVRIPLATSSLLNLPLAVSLAGPNRPVGLVTFDKSQLSPRLLSASGLSADMQDRVVIVGMEHSRTWHELRRPTPDISAEDIIADSLASLDRLLETSPDIGALLLECSALGIAADAIRSRVRVPVLDYPFLVRSLVASLGHRPEPGS